ncbi:hypothetical protein OIU74_014205 [Salix koriyanagi]|uniref:Transmembrane protein n=1 Tax=Salix koriyanagi TaxID=2511006 RepID=A0A9Q0SYR7_9ROSI|nr:hypothetical protein OIU74_014205 [Salix koriyanagi]
MTSSTKFRPTQHSLIISLFIRIKTPSTTLRFSSQISYSPRRKTRAGTELRKLGKMSDWGPVFMAVVLFILLTPGLLFQVPGRHQCVEFGNFQTSGASIMVHTLLYFSLICVFLLAVKVHLYLG